jgi:hypothetical protein
MEEKASSHYFMMALPRFSTNFENFALPRDHSFIVLFSIDPQQRSAKQELLVAVLQDRFYRPMFHGRNAFCHRSEGRFSCAFGMFGAFPELHSYYISHEHQVFLILKTK